MTTLFHVSDLHFGREDKDAIRWFAERVEAERPDAVICTGDLTMRARSAEFEAAGRYLEAMPVPVTVEPGNHDLPYFNPIDRFFRPYRRFGRVERLIERPLDLPGVTIVPLKTTARAQWRHNWSWGVVSRSGLSRALAILEGSQPAPFKIIACHHPLIDKEGLESSGRTLGGRAALEALALAGAQVVLSGHVHDPFDVVHRFGDHDIRTVGAGTLSERLRSTPPSFNQLELDAGKLRVVVRTMDNKPAQTLETQAAPAGL